MSTHEATGAGRFEYAGLDRLLHERARLGIVTSLAAHPAGLPFTELKRLCNLTDGNLSRHLTVLQAAGMVSIRKGFDHKRPLTLARLTAAGRDRFTAYLAELEQVVADAAAATAARPARRPAWAPEGSGS